MSKIFISYRRADSQHITDRIYDRLIGYHDDINIFRDVNSIDIGENFIFEIEKALFKTDIFIVVIGENWVGEQEDGTRRIDDEKDLVRIELERAIGLKLQIIPILVNGASMPENLPHSIKSYIRPIDALKVRGGPDFENDIERLFHSLPKMKKKKWLNYKWVLMIGLILGAIVWIFLEKVPIPSSVTPKTDFSKKQKIKLYPSGKIHKKTLFNNNEETIYNYLKSGELSKIEYYKNHSLKKVEYYYSNGSLESVLPYFEESKNNYGLHGIAKYYDANGSLVREITYDHNKIVKSIEY